MICKTNAQQKVLIVLEQQFMLNKLNKIKETPRIAVKFANSIFILGILFSILLIFYAIYKIYNPLISYINPPGPVSPLFYVLCILSGTVFVALFSLGLKLKNKLKIYLSVFFLTASASVYGLETYLELYRDNYNFYFGKDRFIDRDYYGGTYAKNKNDNNYNIFSASGMDFIVINLDWDSDFKELEWANNLLQTFKEHRAIVVSHYILGGDFENQQDNKNFSFQGQKIFNALKKNPNLFLMLSGHIAPNGENMRTDVLKKRSETYTDNFQIHSILSNYQDRFRGGNGWLRILQFSPTTSEIRVKTYSPWLDSWEIDENSEFTLFYNMSNPELSIEDQKTNSSITNENFSIVVIPDTQYYSERFPLIFNSQTQWIADNYEAWNIVYVTHLGDIVNNYSSIAQWRIASKAMNVLEEVVSERFPHGIPYGVVPGNHDLLMKNKSKKENIKDIIKIYNLRNAIGLIPSYKQ